MKRSTSFFVMVFALIGIQFSVFYGVSFAKQYHLRFWTHDSPQGYRVQEINEVFAKRVKEATNGNVIITVEAMTPITTPRETHDAVAAGIVEMADCITGVSPGRYPMLDSIALPALGYRSSEMASIAAAKMLERYPQIEKRMGNVGADIRGILQTRALARRSMSTTTVDA